MFKHGSQKKSKRSVADEEKKCAWYGGDFIPVEKTIDFPGWMCRTVVSRMMESNEVKVELLDLVYTCVEDKLMEGRPHAFAYRIRITNEGDSVVTLDARKWVLHFEDGRHEVYEGDRIVGEIVKLEPGAHFEYSSYHIVDGNCEVDGAYHGFMEDNSRLCVRIPKFHLHIPENFA